MPYIAFSDEQKQRANQVDLEDFLLRHGEELEKAGREKRWAANHSVTVRSNKWYDHAEEKGGLAIDFLQTFYGLSFPEAVSRLLGGEDGELNRLDQPEKEQPPKPFALPPAHRNMRRVFAYLTKQRGIAPEVISAFAHDKLLYQSCELSKDGSREYHNAVFVGYDENNIPRHAHQRSLNSQGKVFRINIESSQPQYSFHRIGEGERLYIFEAPIDLLSFITLYPADWQNHSYVAMNGITSLPISWLLEQYPHLTKVALCLDNDQAGHKGVARLTEEFRNRVTVIPLLPTAKDWNDMLREPQQTLIGGDLQFCQHF